MPLIKTGTKRAMKENFHELRHGKTVLENSKEVRQKAGGETDASHRPQDSAGIETPSEETSMKCYINGPASKVIVTRKNQKSNTHNTKSEPARKSAPRKRA